LWIDHVGYYKGPNPLLWIGHNVIVVGRKRIQPQNILKVVITTHNNKSALPMKRNLRPHVPDSINKEASTSFGHTLTCSSKYKFRVAVGEEGERVAHPLGEDILH